ncbi:hypothetical protein N7528_003692 [Penicillium herquei]|nr:hypothetical protein N7528_003692 [Penicillium herquei]
MNANYDTDDFNSADLDSSVASIHIKALTNEENAGDEDGNPPTNHWIISLEPIETSSARVMLDMSPGYGSDGQRGKIHLSSNPDAATDQFIRSLTIPLTTQATVRTITDSINSKGRDRYRFTTELEGCKFWIFTLISDLETTGLVASGSGNAVWGEVSQYWRNPTGSEAREVSRGVFY